jgi:hypothetical protein
VAGSPAIDQADQHLRRGARVVVEQRAVDVARVDGDEVAAAAEAVGNVPGDALGAVLRFDIGGDAGAIDIGPVVGSEGRGAGLVVAIHDGRHRGGEDGALDA